MGWTPDEAMTPERDEGKKKQDELTIALKALNEEEIKHLKDL